MTTLFLGLDYAAADVAWRALGLAMSADDFLRLSAIEHAAAARLNGGRP